MRKWPGTLAFFLNMRKPCEGTVDIVVSAQWKVLVRAQRGGLAIVLQRGPIVGAKILFTDHF
jgi:hypothetical protein